jgi:hypothetical protein
MNNKSLTIISSFNANLPKINKDYEASARRFAYSIRKNGGKCKDCRIIFWIDRENPPTPDTICYLVDLGCDFVYGDVVLKQPTPAGSWSSKLYAVNECNFYTPYAVWMDIDFYCLGDFSELLEGEFDIAVPPMNLVTNFGASEQENEMWRKYFSYFGLPAPTERITTHVDKKPGNFYFTSSIMVYKNNINFGFLYKTISSQIRISSLPYNDKRFSQTAVPILIKLHNLKYKILPRHLAYMYHLNDYQLRNDEKVPILVHYCDNKIDEVADEDWNI